jgi:hypothetical protein
LPDSRRRGIFALIRSREDALHVVTDASVVFLLAAAILAALYLMEGEKTLLDVGLFGFLGVMLWRFTVMRLFVTLAQIIDTGELSWLQVVLSVVVILTSIRAAEATLKLMGRFADESQREGKR